MEVVTDTSQWFFIGDVDIAVADAATQTIGTIEISPPMPQEISSMPDSIPPMPPMPPMPFDTGLTIAMGALIGIVGSSVGALLWHRWHNMTNGEPLPVRGQTEMAKTMVDTDPLTAKSEVQSQIPMAQEVAGSLVQKDQPQSVGLADVADPANLLTKAMSLSESTATLTLAWESKSPLPLAESLSPIVLPKTAHLIKSPDIAVSTLAKQPQTPNLANLEAQMPYNPSEHALISTLRKNQLWQDCLIVGLAATALLIAWSKGIRLSKFVGVMPHKKPAIDTSCGVYVKPLVVPTSTQSTAVTQEAQPSQSVVQQVMPEPIPRLASQERLAKDVNDPPQSRLCQFCPDEVSVDVGFEIMRASALSPVKPAMHQADVYISNGKIRPPPPTSSRIFRILPK